MTESIRFKFDYEKCIQAIQFLAENKPSITQYYVGKIMFFADKEHLQDWGRPISGDRYVAMEHGPVPSNTYDIIKSDAGSPDEVENLFRSRVDIKTEGNLKHLSVRKGAPSVSELTQSDKEYLLSALHRYGEKTFGWIKEESHKDPAYADAWAKSGLNNEMNLALWFNEDQILAFNQSSSVQRAVM